MRQQAALENQQLSDQLLALRQQIEALSREREDLMQEKSSLEVKCGQAEKSLRSLELEGHIQRLGKLRERNHLLSAARKELETELKYIADAQGITCTGLDMGPFQAELQNQEQWLSRYQQAFRHIVRQLGGDEDS